MGRNSRLAQCFDVCCASDSSVTVSAERALSVLSWGLLRVSVMRQRLNIVDQAIQLPLAGNFNSAPQCEAVQPLVVPQVPEHWLRRRESSANHLPPTLAVELALHPRGMGLRPAECASQEDGH